MKKNKKPTAQSNGSDFQGIPQSTTPEETKKMLHELRLHQIELETQNEELRKVHAELDASRALYFDLYDLAPVGYLTLSEKGIIVEANQTAATLFGVVKGVLINRRLSSFVFAADQDIYCRHQRQLFLNPSIVPEPVGVSQSCQLRMTKEDGTVFWANLEARAARDCNGLPIFRIILSDISERKCQEDMHEMMARLTVLINTIGDFRECMKGLASAMQGWSGCEAVGIRLRDGDDFPYYESRGFPPAFVYEENYLCTYGPDGKVIRDENGDPKLACMCGNILSGRFDPSKPFFTAKGSFWSNNTTALLASMAKVDGLVRTRNRCNGEGYESVALIPLRSGDQIFGLLQFNDHRPDRFTPDLITHFERAADNLAISLSKRKAEEALRESELKYRSLVECSSDVIFCVDIDGRYKFVNHIFASTFGKEQDYFVGKTFWDIYSKDQADFRYEKIKKVFQSGEPESFEVEVPLSDKTLYFFATTNPVRDNSGRIVFALTCSKDITERKHAEALLQENEGRVQRKLKSILSPDGDLSKLELSDIIDVDAIQILMNEFYALTNIPNAIIDLKGKVLVGTGWQDICVKFHRTHPDTLKNCIESDIVLNGDAPPGMFKTYLCKNGLRDCVMPLMIGGQYVGNLFTGQFFFEDERPNDSYFRDQAKKYGFDEKEYMAALRKVPVWDRRTVNIAFKFYVSLASMITTLSYGNIALARSLEERRRVEDALRESEDRYRSLVELSPEAVIVHSDGKIMYLNKAATMMFGASDPGVMIGKAIRDFVHPDYWDRVSRRVRRMHENKERAPLKELVYKGLYGQNIDVETVGVPIMLSGKIASLTVIRDITERKKLERTLRQSLHEKDVLLKEVHHRVKNNLQIVSGLLKMESAQIEQPVAREVFGKTLNRIRSIALIHECLYSTDSFAPVDLASYLDKLCTQLFVSFGRADIIKLQLELSSVLLDVSRAIPCGLLVNELVSNCLKHAFPFGSEGTVRVELHPIDDSPNICLRVADDGVGLPVDIDARRQHSLGLGLVGDLAVQLGGRVDVGAGPGSRFEVVFPADMQTVKITN